MDSKGLFESRLSQNPEDTFSSDEARIYAAPYSNLHVDVFLVNSFCLICEFL